MERAYLLTDFYRTHDARRFDTKLREIVVHVNYGMPDEDNVRLAEIDGVLTLKYIPERREVSCINGEEEIHLRMSPDLEYVFLHAVPQLERSDASMKSRGLKSEQGIILRGGIERVLDLIVDAHSALLF